MRYVFALAPLLMFVERERVERRVEHDPWRRSGFGKGKRDESVIAVVARERRGRVPNLPGAVSSPVLNARVIMRKSE